VAIHKVVWSLAMASVVLAQAGCSGSVAMEGEELGESQQNLVNSDEFLYLRCNATGWNPQESTRLKSTGVSGVVSLTYNVTVPWMVQQDQCIVLRTNQLNGWGSVNSTFTDAAPATALNVPKTENLLAGSQNFNVHYPVAGSYTATVDWNTKTIKIESTTPKLFNIVGHVSTPTANTSVPPASLPAITVNLGGAQTKTTVTDANGNFRFQVPTGNYTLASVGPAGSSLVKSGAIANLTGLAADTIQDFSCTGTCVAANTIDAARELVITSDSVVTSARASNLGANAGPWSFRAMIEQMTPVGVDPADFAASWLTQFSSVTTFNGFPVSVRDTAQLNWPLQANGKLDLTRSPFRLLAIVNREDVSAQGVGEGRFVYGVVDAAGNPQSMTVIFEYGLPATDANGAALTRSAWAAKFHALGALTLGSEPYNAALQAVTDLFTRRNTSPGKPGGSSINQVRSNEILLGSPWELREFHLTNVNNVLALRLSATGNTPAEGAKVAGSAANQALLSYISENAPLLHGGYATLPASTLGAASIEDFSSWGTFLTGAAPAGLHTFAGMTCNGCHNNEAGNQNIDSFYMISPFSAVDSSGTSRLAPFITNFEIPRRIAMMQNLLTCSGATCSAGAEAMLTQ
jgi:hypothetical protein